MEKGNASPQPENRIRRSLRVLRPLFWWLLLVLVLYGIRTHQRLMEQTRLTFSVSLEGQTLYSDATPTFDGKPAFSGELISLGSHTFTVTHPKGETFSTNLFTWYGGHDFGRIVLKRAKGTLVIQSNPRAARLIVLGPEFTKTLTNSTGGTLLVPSDSYAIEATYSFSEQRDNAVVSANGISIVRIAPRFGTVHIASSHSNTTYRLAGKGNSVWVSGELPGTIGELPVGDYEVMAERRGERQTKALWVSTGRTNEAFFKYEYGAVTLESDPTGATVLESNGHPLGTTPLTVLELRPGACQFSLQLEGFEPAMAALDVITDQTNRFEANLVSRSYTAALGAAQRYFAAGQFEQAAESAGEALKHKAGDAAAISLQREGTGFSHLALARMDEQRGDFTAGIMEANAALESIPDNADAKQLLSDLESRQRQREDLEARQLAEKRVTEERRKRIDEVRSRLDIESQRYDSMNSYARHELMATNAVKKIGEVVQDEMRNRPPVFEISRYDWLQSNTFLIDANQNLPDGSRQCVVVGAQISQNETLICFKVIESQTSHTHSASLLGGLVQAQVTTDADRSGERAARFQEQIREGAPMVEQRIRRAIGH